MLRWEKVENLASLFQQERTPVIPKEVKQENQKNHIDKVESNTTSQSPSRDCNAAVHLKTNDVEEDAFTTKKVSFEPQPVDYKWLREVEVSQTPKSFLLRKKRRMFLEQVIASGGRNCSSNQAKLKGEKMTLYTSKGCVGHLRN